MLKYKSGECIVNPSTKYSEAFDDFLFESDDLKLMVPLWQAMSPQTSATVLENLMLKHSNGPIGYAAAGNPSTPTLACVKWLLEHGIDLAQTKLKWALPDVLEVRVNNALAENGCNMVDVKNLPLSWKLKLLVTLG